MSSVLIIDDEPNIRRMVGALLRTSSASLDLAEEHGLERHQRLDADAPREQTDRAHVVAFEPRQPRRRAEAELQKLTDEMVGQLDTHLKTKEAEILEV